MELYLLVNLIILFATIKDLFNYLENIFVNLYWKKYIMKKFQELKIDTSLFDNFYLEFFYLALKLKYTSKILICKFKYKLMSQL